MHSIVVVPSTGKTPMAHPRARLKARLLGVMPCLSRPSTGFTNRLFHKDSLDALIVPTFLSSKVLILYIR